MLWDLVSEQSDESLYLRLIHAFGPLHRRFGSDDDLIRRAIERNWNDVLRWLETIGTHFDQPDADGEFPLHHAARHGNADAVDFLLTLGVNPVPRARDGKTPLGRASFCGGAHGKQVREVLWAREWPAAAARLAKLDEMTRPTPE